MYPALSADKMLGSASNASKPILFKKNPGEKISYFFSEIL